MSVRGWSFGRVLVISVLWALAVLLLIGWRAFNAFRGVSESGGMVGISAGTSHLLKLAALVLGPPVVLFVTWVAQRR